ncbi:MAG: DUF1559 domain-containing protein [Pirellula sp.]
MKFNLTIASIAVVAICIALVFSFLVTRARDAAREISCHNTFKMIGLALQNYNDHGHFCYNGRRFWGLFLGPWISSW